jgi:hypothetical protein
MSLENTLERIAVALEAIAGNRTALIAVDSVKVPNPSARKVAVPKPPAPPAEKKLETASAPVPATPVTEVPVVPTPPVPETLVVDSPEQCNGMLIEEYNRLGATAEVMQRILGVMEANFNVRSVNDLTKEQYGPLITAVRAL